MSPILAATDLIVRFGERTILDNATLGIDSEDRIGLVGRNGCGKTTFLRILAGLQSPDGGEVTRRRDLVTSYLPQDFMLDPALSVFENVREGGRHVLNLIQEFETLPQDSKSKRHEELEHRIQALDGWTLDRRIEVAMSHLNCPPGDRRIESLSGGEKRRVAICREIVSCPDFLMLDEPTNHLDPESIEWLSEFLETCGRPFLVVTHDRYFLDRVVNRIVELSDGKFWWHKGNYTDYLLDKSERQAADAVIEHKRQMFLKKMQPTEGTVKVGQLTKFNYVDQGRIQLNEERTVLDEVADGTEFVQWGESKLSLRAYLKRFLFADDRITTLVKKLSGGERSRLLLARILKTGGNFLILDEPTNDLDLPTLRVLEEALIAFPGVVCLVSHDRYFLNRVCTDILAFEGDGTIKHSVGDYDYYLEKKQRAAQEQDAYLAAQALRENSAARPAIAPEPAAARTSKPRKLSFKEARELEGMEAQIHATDEKIARIEAAFASPDFHRTHGARLQELTDELAAGKQTLARLYARWEELEAIKSAQRPS